MLAKFTSRRYVMLCTVIVTTWIAIRLNPVVFWLAGLAKPVWRTAGTTYSGVTNELLKPEIKWDSGDWKQIAVVWACATLVCVAICLVICAFNKVTAWIFGEK